MPTFKKYYVNDDYYVTRKNLYGYYLHCDRCGYETSTGKTFEKAAEIWNKNNNAKEGANNGK